MYLKFNLIKIYTQPNIYILSINFHIYYHWDILILVMHNPINLWILWPKIKVVNEAQFITVYSGKKKTFIQKKSNHFFSYLSLSLSLSLISASIFISKKKGSKNHIHWKLFSVYQLHRLNYFLNPSIYSQKG